jgi:hypothetical protein
LSNLFGFNELYVIFPIIPFFVWDVEFGSFVVAVFKVPEPIRNMLLLIEAPILVSEEGARSSSYLPLA